MFWIYITILNAVKLLFSHLKQIMAKKLFIINRNIYGGIFNEYLYDEKC